MEGGGGDLGGSGLSKNKRLLSQSNVPTTCKGHLRDGFYFDNPMCCHTDTEVVDQTCYPTQSHCTSNRTTIQAHTLYHEVSSRAGTGVPIFKSLLCYLTLDVLYRTVPHELRVMNITIQYSLKYFV